MAPFSKPPGSRKVQHPKPRCYRCAASARAVVFVDGAGYLCGPCRLDHQRTWGKTK